MEVALVDDGGVREKVEVEEAAWRAISQPTVTCMAHV